jgi:dephospho-CoA kinase
MRTKHSKLIIGLTGLIASGKTEAAKAFRSRGITVIDVDEFAHSLYVKGKPLYKKLLNKYGRSILGSDGGINRPVLAKIVFNGEKEHRSFNRLVFPRLNKGLQSAIRNLKSKIVVLDMAVLFESGFYKKADIIVFVRPGAAAWRRRIGAMKNSAFIKKALKFQKIFGLNKKIALSDYILYNDKDKAALKRRADVLIKIIKDIYGRKRL